MAEFSWYLGPNGRATYALSVTKSTTKFLKYLLGYPRLVKRNVRLNLEQIKTNTGWISFNHNISQQSWQGIDMGLFCAFVSGVKCTHAPKGSKTTDHWP